MQNEKIDIGGYRRSVRVFFLDQSSGSDQHSNNERHYSDNDAKIRHNKKISAGWYRLYFRPREDVRKGLLVRRWPFGYLNLI
jgi:hypothetical protein